MSVSMSEDLFPEMEEVNENSTEETYGSELDVSVNSVSATSQPAKRSRRNIIDDVNQSFKDAVSSFKDYLNKKEIGQSQKQMSEDEQFAQTVVNMLSTLEEERKKRGKAEILKYIAEENVAQFE